MRIVLFGISFIWGGINPAELRFRTGMVKMKPRQAAWIVHPVGNFWGIGSETFLLGFIRFNGPRRNEWAAEPEATDDTRAAISRTTDTASALGTSTAREQGR